MTIQINYKSTSFKKNLNNLVLFVDENFNINPLKKYISNNEFSYISDLLKNSDLKNYTCYQKYAGTDIATVSRKGLILSRISKNNSNI